MTAQTRRDPRFGCREVRDALAALDSPAPEEGESK